MEGIAETSLGHFKNRKRANSDAGASEIRDGGRNFRAGAREIISDSERGNQISIFMRTQISRPKRQRRMQIRLSARAPGVVEGSGSSRGSDLRAEQPEDFRGRTCAPAAIFLISGGNVRSDISASPLTWTCCQLAYRSMHSSII
jgi:hypothetical protein